MLNSLLLIGRYVIRVLALWVLCSINCEFRNYRWGHKYIKAFDAETPFQFIFTILQSRKDTAFLGAITYVGYYCSIISTIAIIGTVAISVVNNNLWYVFDTAFIVCAALNLVGFLLQVFDSVLNRIFFK